ncbi:MAG: C-GCAxxG-C-C family protein [Deltaproteobacteria bacterium]|jgi:C_GCAxxG_C_C family probable redox protein|nr:C-GCAxxG-C-C family protein [Deltaproteobacteria bacterium]
MSQTYPPEASSSPPPARLSLPICEELVSRAVELFQTGMDCQEAVMRTFEEVLCLGLMEDFGPVPHRRGGLAASSICGSLVGATSVLLATLAEGDDRSANLTLELLRTFRERYGSIACQNLTRSMGPSDYHAFCAQYVSTAVEGLYEILERNLS